MIMGALSIMSSDSQAMGRVGEVIIRTWQTADKMKKQFGRLSEEKGDNDNFRARRYIAKYTINPAIAQGISAYVGSIEVGKARRSVHLGSGLFRREARHGAEERRDRRRNHGRPERLHSDPQPEYYRPMFGAFGRCLDGKLGHIRQSSGAGKERRDSGLSKKLLPVTNTRKIGKHSMMLNDATPRMEVNPETYEVRADGRLLTCEPARVLPMAQRYFMY